MMAALRQHRTRFNTRRGLAGFGDQLPAATGRDVVRRLIAEVQREMNQPMRLQDLCLLLMKREGLAAAENLKLDKPALEVRDFSLALRTVPARTYRAYDFLVEIVHMGTTRNYNSWFVDLNQLAHGTSPHSFHDAFACAVANLRRQLRSRDDEIMVKEVLFSCSIAPDSNTISYPKWQKRLRLDSRKVRRVGDIRRTEDELRRELVKRTMLTHAELCISALCVIYVNNKLY